MAAQPSDMGPVPSVSHDYVCGRCLGPVSGYEQCAGCLPLFKAAPWQLRDAVVPMTTALKSSHWYAALGAYKDQYPGYAATITAVASAFLSRHADAISDMLGGTPDVVTIVPSKKGMPYKTQPLREVLNAIQGLPAPLRQTLDHVKGSEYQRQVYDADRFTRAGTSVDGKRVLLIEDTWVSGATALSAAGTLIELGAASVALLPIARLVDASVKAHPQYRKAIAKSLAPTKATDWPR